MHIDNETNHPDYLCLYSPPWSGILEGIDGYPIKNNFGYYCIAGGNESMFKAIAIEFYGVKT